MKKTRKARETESGRSRTEGRGGGGAGATRRRDGAAGGRRKERRKRGIRNTNPGNEDRARRKK